MSNDSVDYDDDVIVFESDDDGTTSDSVSTTFSVRVILWLKNESDVVDGTDDETKSDFMDLTNDLDIAASPGSDSRKEVCFEVYYWWLFLYAAIEGCIQT